MRAPKFNMLQQPKTPGYMQCFKARPGHKLVQCDLSSIEPRIIAEFSKDPMLMRLYGRDAKPGQDVYLFNGAHIALFRDEIRAWYDPDNPSVAATEIAKSKLKKVRAFCKEITLAAGYGASANRLRLSLIPKGFPVTVPEAQIIHRDYWQLYGGIREFSTYLERLWHTSGGWIPNITGRPIGLDRGRLMDVANAFAQSSGHDVLMTFIYFTEQLRQQRNVEMYPWLVDFYDEEIWEVPDAHVPAALQIMRDALDMTNVEYDTEVRLDGVPEVHENLATIKCPDEYRDWLKAKESAA